MSPILLFDRYPDFNSHISLLGANVLNHLLQMVTQIEDADIVIPFDDTALSKVKYSDNILENVSKSFMSLTAPMRKPVLSSTSMFKMKTQLVPFP